MPSTFAALAAQEFLPLYPDGGRPNSTGTTLADDVRDASAAARKKVPASLRVFPRGGHASAPRDNSGSTNEPGRAGCG